MSCERFKSRLLDFALGADDSEFQNHVHGCAACRVELDTQRALLEKIDRGVAALVAAEPSGDFAAHVRRRVAEQAAAPRKWFSGWLPLAAASVIAVVLLVMVLNFGRPPRGPQSARETPPAPVAPVDTKKDVLRETAIAPRPPQGGQLASTQKPTVRIGRPPRPGQMAANREPEVLVPRGEMAAVMRLYEANWDGKADGTSLTATAIPASEILKPWITPELKIAPLEIVPLVEEGKPIGSQDKR